MILLQASAPCISIHRKELKSDEACSKVPCRLRAFSWHHPRADLLVGGQHCPNAPLSISSIETSGLVGSWFGRHRRGTDRIRGGHAVVSDPGLRRVQSEYTAIRS